jgi:predicted HicB family RNase H-like nuclease
MQASGEDPPTAIADKHYSGKFQVRVPEEVHRRLASYLCVSIDLT